MTFEQSADNVDVFERLIDEIPNNKEVELSMRGMIAGCSKSAPIVVLQAMARVIAKMRRAELRECVAEQVFAEPAKPAQEA